MGKHQKNAHNKVRQVKEKTFKIKKRKTKLNLVFDDTKRKEFLGGFRKRNLEKKKKAQEEFEVKLKEERKRIKLESKEEYKKLVVSRRPIPELEQLLSNEYENDDVTVKVVELSTKDIAEKTNWIGQNRPKEELEKSESEEESSEDEIPGMGLKEKKNKEEPLSENEEEQMDDANEFTSKKQIHKAIRNEATKKVQNSKTFQTKNKMESIKQKKKSKRMKHQKKKLQSKKTKIKQKFRGK